MSSTAPSTALTAYRKALMLLVKSQVLEPQDALTILTARDELQRALAKSPVLSPYLLTETQTLDSQLQKNAADLVAALNLKAYRHSVPRAEEQWWWYLDETIKPAETHPSDWLFKGATTLAWAISIGLLVTISGRFLLGGAGVAGLSAIAFSNLLTLIKAKSDLTDAGNEGAKRLFDGFKLTKPQRLRVRFGSTVLLASGLFAFWLALPSISREYNRRGQVLQAEGKLGSAEPNYNRAISIDPDNLDAHYNLGTLYEDIQELDKAETQYLIAARGDFPEAYNNLARLYLQSSDNSVNKALALLSQGFTLVEEQESFPETEFSLYKNLGWALLQQEEDQLAISALDEAISIYEQLPKTEQEYVINPGSAYCLIAQAQEATAQTDALPAWQRCCQLGNRGTPEENAWLTLARERFDAEGLNYQEICQPNALPL